MVGGVVVGGSEGMVLYGVVVRSVGFGSEAVGGDMLNIEVDGLL